MSYFKVNNIDFSMYVNQLKVETQHNYNAQQNASGNTVIDYINSKRVIEVGIIALDDTAMKKILGVIDSFNVSVSFRNPKTNVLENNVNCVIPSNSVDYYTIHNNKAMYKAFTLKFIEL